jgi:hypothetical protein
MAVRFRSAQVLHCVHRDGETAMCMTRDAGKQRDYISYLLRMWRDSGDEGSPPSKEALWRATLQSPHTGERTGFGDLETLFAYLRAQTDGGSTAEKEQRKEQNDDGRQGHL